jgi:hypothetical protein
VSGHLIERLPPGAPEMADFDATVAELDARLSLSRNYDPETVRRYMRGYRRYVDWCREDDVREQTDPELITSGKIRRFTDWMCTVKRYEPQTIWKNIRGVEWLAERVGVDVTTAPARAVLRAYREKLKTVAAAKAAALAGGGR